MELLTLVNLKFSSVIKKINSKFLEESKNNKKQGNDHQFQDHKKQ